MSDYVVESTAEADEHARSIDAWWREQRSAPDLFLEELGQAIAILARMPRLGVPYADAGAPLGIRRLLLRRVGYHVYDSVDDRTVTLRAIWHSARGTGPF